MRTSDARMNAPATSPVMNGYKTISTLHWSTISFGYMKPSTPFISPRSSSESTSSSHPSSTHRAVQTVVEDLRAGGHLGFQHLYAVGPQELVDGVLGILDRK